MRYPVGIRLELSAQTVLGLPQFRRELLAEVLRLGRRTDFHFAVDVVRIGDTARPLHGLIHGLDLPDPESCDQLLCLGEGTVDHGDLVVAKTNALALRTGPQPLAGQHHTGLDQLLVVLLHFGEQLRTRHDARLRVLGRLDNHHHSHCTSPFVQQSICLPRCACSDVWNRKRAHILVYSERWRWTVQRYKSFALPIRRTSIRKIDNNFAGSRDKWQSKRRRRTESSPRNVVCVQDVPRKQCAADPPTQSPCPRECRESAPCRMRSPGSHAARCECPPSNRLPTAAIPWDCHPAGRAGSSADPST